MACRAMSAAQITASRSAATMKSVRGLKSHVCGFVASKPPAGTFTGWMPWMSLSPSAISSASTLGSKSKEHNGVLFLSLSPKTAPLTASKSPEFLICNSSRDRLYIKFADGEEMTVSSEWLRVNPQAPAPKESQLVIRLEENDLEESPMAEPDLLSGQKDVKIEDITLAKFGLEIKFSDCSTPMKFSYALLRTLHTQRWPLMRSYLKDLAVEGKTRTM